MFHRFILAALIVMANSCVQRTQAQVVLTIDAPKVQASTVSGITTENFDKFAVGKYTLLNTPIGTYTSPGMNVFPAGAYGGAGGTGNYFVIGNVSGTKIATLTLTGDAGYFGFWYSAGDDRNVVQLYENSTLEYTLDTAGFINFIDKLPNSNTYFVNPNNGLDRGQPFAYVNFFGTNGTVFNKVVFDNITTGTGFESDNHSVGPASPITGIVVTPEPGTFALLLAGGLTGAGLLLRRLLKQARRSKVCGVGDSCL